MSILAIDDSPRVSTGAQDRLFVARHPIYQPKIEVCAYELASYNSAAKNGESRGADAESINRVFNHSSLERMVGDRQAFIHLTPSAILSSQCGALPRDKVVLELLEDISPGAPLFGALKQLSNQGFQIAISDSPGKPGVPPAAELADIIKLDVSSLSRDEVARRAEQLRALPVKLLADRVHTYDDFEACKALGFDFFEGGFFCKPRVARRDIPPSKIATVRLLAKLQNPSINMKELEETISQDVSLTYKLLRFANSAYTSISRQVESINHAVKLIGLDRIKLWSSIIMFASMEDKPRELMVTSVVRAKLVEHLGSSIPNARKDMYFTVGLLSSLDAMLDCPMQTVLSNLPLTDEIKDALISHKGPLGQALHAALAYEQGDWDHAGFRDLTPGHLRTFYFDSVAWSSQMLTSLLL